MHKADTHLNQQVVANPLPLSDDGAAIKSLVPIGNCIFDGRSIQTVNARDLHTFLENRDHFTAWIRDRIRQYGFVDGVDFVSFSENAEKPTGGRPLLECALTMDMAKELAMVERNEKGRQARRYFLDCERRAKAAQVPAVVVRRSSRRSKEEVALARAEVTRALAETTRVVQEAAASTVKTYADLLQSVLSFDANAAFIAGCNAAKAAHGVDVRQSTAITHIDSESQQTWHTPTELGKIENGLSAVKINQTLEKAGLQTKPDGKQWVPTDEGKKYSRILDTGKKHSSGVPVTQLKWSKDVLQKMGSAI
jgi:phage anti-repressor protein